MIVAITGMPGSGKTTAAEILKKKGFEMLELSEPLKQLMEKKGMPLNTVNMEKFADKILREKGRNIVSKLAIPYIRKMKGDIVLSGVRRMEDVQMIRSALKTKVYLIAVTVPPRIRYERIRHRRGKENIKVRNYKEFLWRDAHNKRLGVLNTLEHADFIISNSGSRAELGRSLSKTIALIRNTKALS